MPEVLDESKVTYEDQEPMVLDEDKIEYDTQEATPQATPAPVALEGARETPSTLDQFGRSFANAATLGHGDEFAALMNAITGGTEEESFWEEYDRNLAQEEALTGAGAEESPITSTAGEIAGFMAGPGKFAKGIGSATGIGAAYGGLESDAPLVTREGELGELWSPERLESAAYGGAGALAGMGAGKLAREGLRRGGQGFIRGLSASETAAKAGQFPASKTRDLANIYVPTLKQSSEKADAYVGGQLRKYGGRIGNYLEDLHKAGGGLSGAVGSIPTTAITGFNPYLVGAGSKVAQKSTATLRKGSQWAGGKLSAADEAVGPYATRQLGTQFGAPAGEQVVDAAGDLYREGKDLVGVGEARAETTRPPENPNFQELMPKIRGTKFMPMLAEAARKGPESYNARLHVLKKNPQFRSLMGMNKTK